jgi:IMP dehydrogenase
MASKEAQMDWRGRFSSNEGIATKVVYKGRVSGVLDDLVNGIRSGLSYSGSKNMEEFRKKAKFVRQTASGLRESRTHILRR